MFRCPSPSDRVPSAMRGFTLYELLVAICIVGSVAAVGVSASDILQDNDKSTAANQLVAYLALARNEAIKRHVRVKLCPSADQRTCLDAGDDYTAWQSGWLLYTDDNRDGRPEAREILHVYAAVHKNLSIRTSRARDQVTYQPTGTAGGSNVTFAFCDARGAKYARYVTINNSGRARVSRTTDGDIRCA